MIKLFHEDYRNIEVGKVDFILCDIPYNIGKNAYASNSQWWKNGNYKNGKSQKADSMFFDTDQDFNINELLEYIKEHLKENSSAILFCSIEQLAYIIEHYKKYKFTKYIPLIFRKNNSAEVLKSNMRIVGCCEYGVQLFNGKLGKFNNERKMIKNCFDLSTIRNKRHPNEKPVEILELFIKLFTNENEVVLDMCMGSGSTGVACKNLNRNFIGIEIDKYYYDISVIRIGVTNENMEISSN